MLTFDQTIHAEALQGRYLALELAALLDRLDAAAARSNRSAAEHPAMRQLLDAIRIVAGPSAQPDRAERLLRHYSDPA